MWNNFKKQKKNKMAKSKSRLKRRKKNKQKKRVSRANESQPKEMDHHYTKTDGESRICLYDKNHNFIKFLNSHDDEFEQPK